MMESGESCVERLARQKSCCLRENNDNCGDERKCFVVCWSKEFEQQALLIY